MSDAYTPEPSVNAATGRSPRKPSLSDRLTVFSSHDVEAALRDIAENIDPDINAGIRMREAVQLCIAVRDYLAARERAVDEKGLAVGDNITANLTIARCSDPADGWLVKAKSNSFEATIPDDRELVIRSDSGRIKIIDRAKT